MDNAAAYGVISCLHRTSALPAVPELLAIAAASHSTHHSFGGSFSAVSTPIFTIKDAFCSIFQNLQENHLLASKFCKHSVKKCNEKLQKFLARR